MEKGLGKVEKVIGSLTRKFDNFISKVTFTTTKRPSPPKPSAQKPSSSSSSSVETDSSSDDQSPPQNLPPPNLPRTTDEDYYEDE